jgi:hypothetical protein
MSAASFNLATFQRGRILATVSRKAAASARLDKCHPEQAGLRKGFPERPACQEQEVKPLETLQTAFGTGVQAQDLGVTQVVPRAVVIFCGSLHRARRRKALFRKKKPPLI